MKGDHFKHYKESTACALLSSNFAIEEPNNCVTYTPTPIWQLFPGTGESRVWEGELMLVFLLAL